MKIISFSLWGDNPKYTQGAVENIKLQKEFFPDWVCRFYVHSSVPSYIYHRLKNDGAEVIDVNEDISFENNYTTDGKHMGWFWRFRVLNDSNIERFIVRDTDSRLSLREKNCVNDWIKSKKPFHIIRDHPHHGVPILAGTWGATKDFSSSINYKKLLCEFIKNNPNNNGIYGGYDQFFLSTVFYPLIKDTACVHDDYFNFEQQRKKIPHIREGNSFIGEDIKI